MSGKSLILGVGAGLVVVGGLWLALGRKDEPAVAIAPVASALAPSTAAASGKVVKFTIDPKGTTTIDMPAPKEHIKAGTSAASGTLEIDLGNLASSRGEVKIDLITLATHTFGNDDDATQTHHAQTWLEVGDAVSAEDREKFRWVTYAIRSIDAVSASDVTKIAPSSAGGDDVRTVTLTAKGDLLLHGRKVENREAQLEARLHYPHGAPADSKPILIELKSNAPLHVILAEHDVKPRDTVGKLAKISVGLVGKVADTADVSIDLKAVPAG